jgi:3-hydroxyisobutyrate dehydrogenase
MAYSEADTYISETQVSFLGLGTMGAAMAARLAKAGVTVNAWNRTQRRFDALRKLGVRLHSHPELAVRDCRFCFMCLLDERASREVVERMLPSLDSEVVVVDHGTIGAVAARDLAEQVADRGASYLDAPVSGGARGAEEATLTIMVGGDEDAFKRVKPLLGHLGSMVEYMGPSGAGQTTKLINQLLTAVNSAAAVEAARLATAAGHPLTQLHMVIQRSFGASAMLDRTLPILAERRFDTTFRMNVLAKDLRLVGELEAELGLDLPLTKAVRDLYAQAIQGGLGDDDAARLFDFLESGRS